MTKLEEIERLLVDFPETDRRGTAFALLGMVKKMRELIDTHCPCCAQDSECLDGCTIAEDDPHYYDRIAYNREILKKIGVL